MKIYSYMCIHIKVRVCVCVSKADWKYRGIQTHTHIHTFTHRHIHTYIHISLSVFSKVPTLFKYTFFYISFIILFYLMLFPSGIDLNTVQSFFFFVLFFFCWVFFGVGSGGVLSLFIHTSSLSPHPTLLISASPQGTFFSNADNMIVCVCGIKSRHFDKCKSIQSANFKRWMSVNLKMAVCPWRPNCLPKSSGKFFFSEKEKLIL